MVVAVDQAGSGIRRQSCGKPVGDDPDIGQRLRPGPATVFMTTLQMLQPARHLPRQKSCRLAEVGQADGLDIDFAQPQERIDHGQAHAMAPVRIAGIRLRQGRGRGRKAIHRRHQVKRRAEHVLVVAVRNQARVRHGRACERLEQVRFPTEALVDFRARARRRAAQYITSGVALEAQQQVLRSARQTGRRHDRAIAKALAIHPREQPRRIEDVLPGAGVHPSTARNFSSAAAAAVGRW